MAEFDIQQLVLVSDATNDAENLEHLGPTIKDVYRNDKMKPFLDQLGAFIRRKEIEIEKMCNSNYQEFVQSVDRLLKVRQGTVDLKNKIHTLNTDVQLAGTELTAKKRELIESKKILENIATATETLKTCIHFLDLANRVNVQVENRKYYSALRIVDEIQVVHLRSVIQFEFARHMQDCIPILQHAIKDAVTTEVKEWLFSIRTSQKEMGKLAMDTMAERQQRWRERSERGLKLKTSHTVNSAVEMAINEESEVDILDTNKVKLDFKPLYQCLHIYDELGQRAEFRNSYAEDRKAQAKLTLSSINSSFNIKDRNTDNFKSLLQDIAGFFIVEHIILYSTTNFRTQSQLDELCDLVNNLLHRLLSDGLSNCQDPDMFLDIKMLLMLYIQTMESYNYPVSKLNDLLLTLFRTYADQLETKFSSSFHKLVDEDDYTPMLVENQEEYDLLQQAFRFKEDRRATRQGFPRTLPFSKVVPYCCEDIRQFVGMFYRFVEGFNQEQNEMDELVKESLDTLLIQHVHSVWLKKLESGNLSQIAQIIINLEYFQGACSDFESLLTESRSTSDTTKISLQATSLFRETRKNAEKRISELVNSKIDDMLELAEYDWLPTGIQELHSAYMQELVSFLSVVMGPTLQSLPDSIKTYVYYDALEHLAAMLHNIFTDPSVKHINQNFVAQFDKDVHYLENFVTTLDNPNVADTFLSLRQLITLLLSENTEEYMDPQIRSRYYAQVKPDDVTRMLEKLMTAPVAATTTQERTKRRSWGKVLEWGGIKSSSS
ncbi:exocyst complex component 6 [Entomortierella parvispora]|uniref:Exocyst complex component SEC15 n=1 Tax=Entomortierella parvispora TaxID=205924 RepID=A0A9P3LW46_9FUNG|nr:exocyst complex component 6 [Entomortierella parvispora]